MSSDAANCGACVRAPRRGRRLRRGRVREGLRPEPHEVWRGLRRREQGQPQLRRLRRRLLRRRDVRRGRVHLPRRRAFVRRRVRGRAEGQPQLRRLRPGLRLGPRVPRLGACQPKCSDGQGPCGGACVALDSDTANCGVCGSVCPDEGKRAKAASAPAPSCKCIGDAVRPALHRHGERRRELRRLRDLVPARHALHERALRRPLIRPVATARGGARRSESMASQMSSSEYGLKTTCLTPTRAASRRRLSETWPDARITGRPGRDRGDDLRDVGEAREAGHVVVGEDEVEGLGVAAQRLEGLVGAREAAHLIARVPQEELRRQQERLLVVDVEQTAPSPVEARGGPGDDLVDLGLDARQEDLERRPAAGRAVDADRALVIPHDAVHDGEPEARALAGALGREERIEDALERRGVHAVAVVDDAQPRPARRPRRPRRGAPPRLVPCERGRGSMAMRPGPAFEARARHSCPG